MLLKPAQYTVLQICQFLQPVCVENRINIAGSVRRKKKEVKDLEIVLLPQLEEFTAGLFSEPIKRRSRAFVDAINCVGKIVQGNPEEGKYIKIKPNGVQIMLDVFIPSPWDYFRQYAIRTGSWEYSNKVLAGGWLRLGWCGSDLGLRKITDCINTKKKPEDKNQWKCVNPTAERPPVWSSENDFFAWLGVEWIPPEARFFSE